MKYKNISIRNIPFFALIIVVCSIALHGHFIWNIWFSPPPEYYPLKFNEAKWIGIPGNLPQGYYRKEVYINGQVRNAWLKIAAPDSYQLYINGNLVGQKAFSSMDVAGIYDITGNLLIGKNVIAASVRRFNINEINRVMVELGYEDKGGIKGIIPSDHTWKVAPVEEWQAHGEIMWNAVEFNGYSWKNAELIDIDNKDNIHFTEFNPALFEKPVEGYWIWGSDASTDRVVLQHPFSVSGKVRDAWLRISIDGRYQLFINNQKVGSSEISQKNLDIYRMAPFIKRGENRITINAVKEPSSPGILVDGSLLSDGYSYRFTGNNWSITTLDSNVSHPVTISATYNLQSDGVLTKNFVDPPVTGIFRFQSLTTQFLWLLLIGAIWIFIWIVYSLLIQRIYDITLSRALLIDSITHLPSILLLGIIYLLKYDISHNLSFPYQERFIIISILLIFIFKLIFILERYLNILPLRGTKEHENSPPLNPLPTTHCIRPSAAMGTPEGKQQLIPPPLMGGGEGEGDKWGFSSETWNVIQKAPIAILLALVIFGGILRIKGLDYQSLYHDEIHMVNYSQGIFDRGYPYKMLGPIERPLATYELLPYPIALSMWIFGVNDFAARLPAAIFGTLTILLIYYISASLFNRWLAILASAVYTFLPPAIVWAQYLFHPQQAQFFALLTSFLFYKAIEKESINKKYLYMATATYIILYLTWEGTGFFLGSLFLGLIAVRGINFGWIRDKHLWTGVGIISGVVIIQLLRRLMLQIPYLVVGVGNSEITGPSLFFLNPMYDPYFYIYMFLWREYNFILTFLCILGIPFLIRHPLLRYYYIMIFGTLFMMTNLFSANAIRYAIYIEPFLIISAAAVLMYMSEYVSQLLSGVSLRAVKTTAYIVVLLMSFVLWAGTNDYIYKFYRVTDASPLLGHQWRSNVYYIDYRSSVRFVANNYQKGDIIISTFPYGTELYGNIETDYFLQSFTARQVLYDITEESPMYLDRTIGIPTLRGLEELNDISNRHHRIWVIATPYRVFQKITDEAVQEYLEENGKVVYESYNARVYLLGA